MGGFGSMMVVGALSFSQVQPEWTRYMLDKVNAYAQGGKPSIAVLEQDVLIGLDNSSFKTYLETNGNSQSLEYSQQVAKDFGVYGAMRNAFAPFLKVISYGGIDLSPYDDLKLAKTFLKDWANVYNNNALDYSQKRALLDPIEQKIFEIFSKNPQIVPILSLATIVTYIKNPTSNFSLAGMDNSYSYISGNLNKTDDVQKTAFFSFLSTSPYLLDQLAQRDDLKFPASKPADLTAIRQSGNFETVLERLSNWASHPAYGEITGRPIANFFIPPLHASLEHAYQSLNSGLKRFFDLAEIPASLDIRLNSSIARQPFDWAGDKSSEGMGCLYKVFQSQDFRDETWNATYPGQPDRYLLRDIFTSDASLQADPNSRTLPTNISNGWLNTILSRNNNSLEKKKFKYYMNALLAQTTGQLAEYELRAFLDQIYNKNPHGMFDMSQNTVNVLNEYLFGAYENMSSNPQAVRNVLQHGLDQKIVRNPQDKQIISDYLNSGSTEIPDKILELAQFVAREHIIHFFQSGVATSEDELPDTPQIIEWKEAVKEAVKTQLHPLKYFYNYDSVPLSTSQYSHLLDPARVDVVDVFSEETFSDFNHRMLQNAAGLMQKQNGAQLTQRQMYGQSNFGSISNFEENKLEEFTPKLEGNYFTPTGVAYAVYVRGETTKSATKGDANAIKFDDAISSGYRVEFRKKEDDAAQNARKSWMGGRKNGDEERKSHPAVPVLIAYREFGMSSDPKAQLKINITDYPKNKIPDGSTVSMQYMMQVRHSALQPDGSVQITGWKDPTSSFRDIFAVGCTGDVFSSTPGNTTLVDAYNTSGKVSFEANSQTIEQNEDRYSPKTYHSDITYVGEKKGFGLSGNPVFTWTWDIENKTMWTDTGVFQIVGAAKNYQTPQVAGDEADFDEGYIRESMIDEYNDKKFFDAGFSVQISRSSEESMRLTLTNEVGVQPSCSAPEYPSRITKGNKITVGPDKVTYNNEKSGQTYFIKDECKGLLSAKIVGANANPVLMRLASPGIETKIIDGKTVTTDVMSVLDNEVIVPNMPVTFFTIQKELDNTGSIRFSIIDKNQERHPLQLRYKSAKSYSDKEETNDNVVSLSAIPNTSFDESKQFEMYLPNQKVSLGKVNMSFRANGNSDLLEFSSVNYDISNTSLANANLDEQFLIKEKTDADGFIPSVSIVSNASGEIYTSIQPDYSSPEWKQFVLDTIGDEKLSSLVAKLEKDGNSIFLRQTNVTEDGSGASQQSNFLLENKQGQELFKVRVHMIPQSDGTIKKKIDIEEGKDYKKYLDGAYLMEQEHINNVLEQTPRRMMG